MSEYRRLIADIGGTNARFAWSDATGSIHDTWVRTVAEFETFEAALAAYLKTLGAGVAFASAAVAAAGPVSGDEISVTNNDWRIRGQQLASQLGAQANVRLVNDLQAVAHAIPFLKAQQLEVLDLEPKPLAQRERMIAVNVGTGFGAAGLIRDAGSWTSFPSESGHMVMGASDGQELELFERLSGDGLSVEEVLSGDGVRRLASALNAGPGDAALQAGRDVGGPNTCEGDALSGEVCAVVTKLFARVCANLTLASGAWGGVYVCGSVAQAWWQRADHAEFRRLYNGRTKMREKLADTPISLITIDHPAFVGLAHMEL